MFNLESPKNVYYLFKKSNSKVNEAAMIICCILLKINDFYLYHTKNITSACTDHAKFALIDLFDKLC